MSIFSIIKKLTFEEEVLKIYNFSSKEIKEYKKKSPKILNINSIEFTFYHSRGDMDFFSDKVLLSALIWLLNKNFEFRGKRTSKNFKVFENMIFGLIERCPIKKKDRMIFLLKEKVLDSGYFFDEVNGKILLNKEMLESINYKKIDNIFRLFLTIEDIFVNKNELYQLFDSPKVRSKKLNYDFFNQIKDFYNASGTKLFTIAFFQGVLRNNFLEVLSNDKNCNVLAEFIIHISSDILAEREEYFYKFIKEAFENLNTNDSVAINNFLEYFVPILSNIKI